MKTYGGFLLSQIHQLSRRIFEKMLRDSGIDAFNGAQGRILYVLWEHEQMNITQIGAHTSLAKTTLTSMLDRMEASGLIRRMPDPSNRRQILVSITPAAKAYKKQYDAVSDEMNRLYYKGFEEAEVEQFEAYLRRILGNLEE